MGALLAPVDRDPAFATGDLLTRLATFVHAYGLDETGRVAFCDVAIAGATLLAQMATRCWHR